MAGEAVTRPRLTVVTLNMWGGRLADALLDYLEDLAAAREVDVICLQEVFSIPGRAASLGPPWGGPVVPFQRLEEALPHHQGLFFPATGDLGGGSPPTSVGVATFVRRGLAVVAVRAQLVHGRPEAYRAEVRGTLPRPLAVVELDRPGGTIAVANYHGLWSAVGKGDLPERLAQSRRLDELLRVGPPRHLLCGDLNLLPTTESFGILARGRQDLVGRAGVQGTRTSRYPGPERFADYVLASAELPVEAFAVEEVEVSDHRPLRVTLGV